MSTDVTVRLGQRRPVCVGGIHLEHPCEVCDSTGFQIRSGFFGAAPEVKSCLSCRGKGVIPNKAGLDLLEFIKRYTEASA